MNKTIRTLLLALALVLAIGGLSLAEAPAARLELLPRNAT